MTSVAGWCRARANAYKSFGQLRGVVAVAVPHQAVLDGETVHLDGSGRPAVLQPLVLGVELFQAGSMQTFEGSSEALVCKCGRGRKSTVSGWAMQTYVQAVVPRPPL